MEREYIIFVPNQEMHEDEIEHSAIVDWAFRNLSHPNVLVLTSDDVYYLQYQSEVLDIINEENQSMLEMYEDDWVCDQAIKERIRQRLNEYLKRIKDARLIDLIKKILSLLDLSVSTNKSIYFNF
jgi:hypothetical protein